MPDSNSKVGKKSPTERADAVSAVVKRWLVVGQFLDHELLLSQGEGYVFQAATCAVRQRPLECGLVEKYSL